MLLCSFVAIGVRQFAGEEVAESSAIGRNYWDKWRPRFLHAGCTQHQKLYREVEKCPLQAKHCPSSRLHKAPLSQFIGSAFSWLIFSLSEALLFELTFGQLPRGQNRVYLLSMSRSFSFSIFSHSKGICNCKIYYIIHFCFSRGLLFSCPLYFVKMSYYFCF